MPPTACSIVVGAGVLAILLSAPRAARADGPAAAPVSVAIPGRVAPLGVGLSVTAGTSLAAGTLAYALGNYGYEECGLTGCFRRPSRGARVAGVALFGAGMGMGAIAAPTLAYGLGPEGRASPRYRSEPMLRAGLSLMTIGVGLGGAALGAHLQGSREGGGIAEGADFAAVMFGVGGGLLLITGVPLWLTGGARAEPADAGAPLPTASPARTSTAMMVAGIVLAGVGAVGIISGAAMLGNGDHGGGGYVGLLVLGAGGASTLVGLPLAVVGSLPARSPSAPSAFEPSIFVGPGSITWRWRF